MDTTVSAFVSRCFTVEATDPACALYRLGSDATNKRFPCVKFQRMQGLPLLRYSNRRVTRRSLRRPRIQLHLMQGKGEFPRISFRRIERQLGLLASSSARRDADALFLAQVSSDATRLRCQWHQFMADARGGPFSLHQLSCPATEHRLSSHRSEPDAIPIASSSH